MACHMNKAPALTQRLRLQSRLPPPPGQHLSPEAFRGGTRTLKHNVSLVHWPVPQPLGHATTLGRIL
ncbi:hypothetical protein MUK42_28360 [Musa troglodytarum]|uniref:Uncharacterized protein n=1 Tax=Musa troglodytarum TaxID=320322 RepID=A0A9E7GA19_9LILI|nr:hypothetical protein MUK42_28360 [Musa troglodytarum]